MSIVRGCEIPEQLYYKVEHFVWARPERDGTVWVGYASPGCVALGEILSFTPRRVGKAVRKGMSCATLQSAHWVEPARSPATGVVVEVNQRALEDPLVINRDPYGGGWLVRIEPEDWGRDCGDLLTGSDAVLAFERLLAESPFIENT